MSTRYCTWIRIGGRIKTGKLDKLLALIRQASVTVEWGDASFEPKDEAELLEALKDGHIWLCDDQACWGEFPELEVACRQLGLAYTRHTEASLDCDAELLDWRPGMREPLVRIGSNVNTKAAYVPAASLHEVIGHLEAGLGNQALRRLRTLCPTISELPPFEII